MTQIQSTQSLTWQNIPAFCLSFPLGQGPKSACSQAHPYKHPHTPTQCVQASRHNLVKIMSHAALSHFFLVLQRNREGISWFNVGASLNNTH